MIEFLKLLDDKGIPCVSWKNNHELADALAGKSDLDIFIPVASRDQFLQLASIDGWIRFENPVARYPWGTHLYKLGDDLRVYRLHVYFKLVTGESWIKEYILFWVSGTRWAFAEAIREDYDFYLWLNYDTRLKQDAMARIYATYLDAQPKPGESADGYRKYQ